MCFTPKKFWGPLLTVKCFYLVVCLGSSPFSSPFLLIYPTKFYAPKLFDLLVAANSDQAKTILKAAYRDTRHTKFSSLPIVIQSGLKQSPVHQKGQDAVKILSIIIALQDKTNDDLSTTSNMVGNIVESLLEKEENNGIVTRTTITDHLYNIIPVLLNLLTEQVAKIYSIAAIFDVVYSTCFDDTIKLANVLLKGKTQNEIEWISSAILRGLLEANGKEYNTFVNQVRRGAIDLSSAIKEETKQDILNYYQRLREEIEKITTPS